MSDAPHREPRRWGFWFIASLCLNFFLIGVVVTGLLVARNRMIAGAISGGGGGLAPETVLQMLPPSGAVKMCDVLASRVEDFRKLGRETVDARRAVFKIFRTEPFDPGTFRQALARLTASQVAVLQAREAAIAEVVARLDPDERKKFTRKILQRLVSFARPAEMQKGSGKIAAICESVGAASAKNLPQ